MKNSILAVLASAFLTSTALAAPAVPGTLASYLALGAGGATIGSTLFSDFALLPLQTGAVQIDPNSILVNPINLFNNPGLEFVVNQTAASSQLFELRLTYKVADASILGASVGLTGSVVTPDGANTALLALTGPASSPTLIAFDIGLVSDNPVSGMFAPVSLVSVETDIVVDGGTAGTAMLTSATNRFVVAGPVAAVPEPGSALAGVVALGLCISRRCRQRRRA